VRGRGYRRDVVLGSNVDQVITQARCDVLVERIGARGTIESILVPTAGGPHAEFAAEIAHAIALVTGARVEVIYVITPDVSDDARTERILTSTASVLEDVEMDTLVVEGDEVVETIVEHSADHDMTIIGATRESLLQQLVVGTIPEEVGRRASNTVIMAKRDLGITSRLNRWFRGR
jgi:nucleotide-binding universal stress UspA family protein